MRTILYIAGAAIVAVIAFVVYRYIKVLGLSFKQNQIRSERIRPLINLFDSGHDVRREDVLPFAEGLLTREATYRLLRGKGRLDLFPEHLMSVESSAAGNLANWLEFPTELASCPDEMEHVGRYTFQHDARNFHYHVFRYRKAEPHWAAPNGWMLGAAGPYFDDSEPYDFPAGTFSRCSSTEKTTDAETEARWIHENIGLRTFRRR